MNIMVGSRPWNKDLFYKFYNASPQNWFYIDMTAESPINDLRELASAVEPEHIFFVHCSHIIPADIYENYECIVFHPSNLPDGRGGTPIQNQILRGYTETKVSAFRMTGKLDAGPVYMKMSLSLGGSLHEIFKREMYVVESMINYIIREKPEPQEQTGYGEVYHRRIPQDSELYYEKTMEQVYDAIRMMDAPTYPKAFIKMHEIDIELFDATLLRDNTLTVSMRLKQND